MLRRLLLLALLASLTVPAASEATVTIKTSGKTRDIAYGDALRVKGKAGAYRGPVTLEIDEFPYDDKYVDTATADTNDKGEYVFPRVGPSRNARLRTRAGNERSKAIEVFVWPAVKAKGRRVDYDHDRVVITIAGHPGFTIPVDKLYIYMRKRGTNTLQRLGGARTMSQVRDGAYRYVGLVRLPSSKRGYRYNLRWCLKDRPAGYGRSLPEDRACGDPRIDVR